MPRTFNLAIALIASTLALRVCADAGEPVLPRPEHVVVVIEENHSFSSLVGNPEAPYINSLANKGALFTQSFALAHPSLPNYIMLFSGSNHGVTDDGVPRVLLPFSAPNLGAQLIAAGFTFCGYSEGLPEPGFYERSAGRYARKHNPWVNWQGAPSNEIPRACNQPLSSWPTDLNRLPTVAFVIPNLDHDMHDGSIAQADAWLKDKLDAYVRWAADHNSLLILTFDEDDYREKQRILTFFVGPMVRQGRLAGTITHYDVLRTLEALYGLPPVGAAAQAKIIDSCWQPAPAAHPSVPSTASQ